MQEELTEKECLLNTGPSPELLAQMTIGVQGMLVRTPDVSGTNLVDDTVYEEMFNECLLQHGLNNPLTRPAIPKLKYRPGNSEVLRVINNILGRRLHSHTTLEEAHSLIYCAALTVIKINGQKPIATSRVARFERP